MAFAQLDFDLAAGHSSGAVPTILQPSDDAFAQAAACLRAGGLLGLPTETVYGLAANAADDAAVGRIFAAKGRPSDHPLIIHVAEAAALDLWAREISDEALRLAEAFWPGPLTLILKRGPSTSRAVTGGLDTVAVRVPQHPVALAVLRAFGGGVAAPSANKFGSVSPTTAAHVADGLGEAVGLIIDGGACNVGVESTIVDVSQTDPANGVAAILRPGGVPQEALAQVLGKPMPVRVSEQVRAPGQLPSHYAPEARVRIVDARELAAEAATLAARGLKVAVLTSHVNDFWPPGVEAVFLPANPEDAARRLYAALREVDQRQCHVVLSPLPLEVGVGVAVADRLRKAAGPR